ncbi:MAG TPA: glycosyltransferase family 4 protein [Ktedonosporobacter sp.]|jgi:glycosyltransferase involved in cell wall biosynthesis|nr:glycosyltransferase family 4 protein [Ktedonosporobacter sp.]
MRKAKNILMVVENLSVPSDPRVWREAQTLRQLGFRVCIISPKGETRDKSAYDCIDGIHIYRYHPAPAKHTSFGYMKEYLLALLKTFGLSLKIWYRHGFSVIHAANPPDIFFILGLFYRFFGKAYVFDQHDLAPEMFRVKFQGRLALCYRLLRFCEYYSYRTADIVITTNASQRQLAIKRGRCHPEKVFVVRNGPDIARYAPVAAEPSLKQGKRFLLVYIGIMGTQDGVDYALYALQKLVHQRGRQDVLLALMGDGDQLPALKALTHQLRLDPYVHFTGWVQRHDLLRYLTMADIGLSPDPSNELNDRSTMLKTMEYMAMGKPVVAFDLPETRYSAQEAALYATANSVEDFADKIAILLDDAELRRHMGAYGRKRIAEELCWERSKLPLWRAYETLFATAGTMEVETASLSAKGKEDLLPSIIGGE